MPSRYSTPVPNDTNGGTRPVDGSTRPIHAICIPPSSTTTLQTSAKSSASSVQRTMAALHALSARYMRVELGDPPAGVVALGDVPVGADHAQRGAVAGPLHHHPTVQDPDEVAVAVAHAVLELEQW